MAALTRPVEATYAVHDNVTIDTPDQQDHTFCGIMFAVKCNNVLPVGHIVIHSVSVRGRLGPITVWVCDGTSSDDDDDDDAKDAASSSPAATYVQHHNAVAQSYNEMKASEELYNTAPQQWTKIYEKHHSPSWHHYEVLDFSDAPIFLKPGQMKAIYVHSAARTDESIVYDNQRSRWTGGSARSSSGDTDVLSIISGARAHLSDIPFDNTNLWGWQGAWRFHREFVGRISYGAVYKLWNPQHHVQFGSKFQQLTLLLLMCQRRWESPMSLLPDEVIYYILNICRWDWANDTITSIRREQQEQRDSKKHLSLQSSDGGGGGEQRHVTGPSLSLSSSWCGKVIRWFTNSS